MQIKYVLPSVVLSIMVFFSLSGCSSYITSDASWGGQATNEIVDGESFHYFWHVHGYSFYHGYKSTVETSDWEWDYYHAVILVVPFQDDQPQSLPFNLSYSLEFFRIDEQEYLFTKNSPQKIVFYTDEQQNVRKLVVDSDLGFFVKHHEERTTAKEVIDFWRELQSFNSESTVFWHNEASKIE